MTRFPDPARLATAARAAPDSPAPGRAATLDRAQASPPAAPPASPHTLWGVVLLSVAACILAALLMLGLSAPAGAQAVAGDPMGDAQPVVMLATPAALDREQLVLGDVFMGLDPALAATVIGRAPAPGESLTLTWRPLLTLAQRHDLAWRPLSQLDRVVIHRAGTALDPAMVEQALADALLTAGLGPSQAGVALMQPRALPAVAPGALPRLEVRDLRHDGTTHQLAATVVLHTDDGRPAQALAVLARVTAELDVPVPVRAIARGEVLGEGDLTWARLPAARVGAGMATELAALVGLEARAPLRAGQPVPERALRRPIATRKGDPVTVVLDRPPLLLTVRARALEDGAVGQPIRLENLSSGRSLEATLVAADLAVVDLARDLDVRQRLQEITQ